MYKEPNNTEFDRLKSWHWKMSASSQGSRKYKAEDEAYYFADVDNTRTQFSSDQLDQIKIKYDIPISSKLSYAIIEQILSLLTGTRPYTKLVSASSNPNVQDFVRVFEAALTATWYESQGNEELALAVRDALVVGEGYLHVRKSNFYSESTLGVVFEYEPWAYVYIDPNAKKNDYSDAEMMCVAKIISKAKAENEFDVKIPDDDLITKDNGWGMGLEFGQTEIPYYTWTNQNNKGDAYVWTREFYEKKNVWVYVAENGSVGTKRPVPTQIPNEEKMQLGVQIEQMKEEFAQAGQAGQQLAEQSAGMDQLAVQQEDPSAAVAASGEGQAGMQEANAHLDEIQAQLQEAMVKYSQMPDMLDVYLFEPLSGEEFTTPTYSKLKKKHIVRTFCVGNKIYERETLMTDEYPIIAFNISHNKSPNKVYGITHYIKDIVKALNKFWAIIIYDAQVHGQRKVVAEETTIVEKKKWQNEWAIPGAILTYKANPLLPDGGKPTILEASPLNQAYTQLLVLLQQLAEYITGTYAVLQGNMQPNMPDSMGGIQSMQAAGGQRIKHYSRFFETSLEQLAYVTVSYLQQYAPRDQVLKYFDENGDGKEVEIMNGGEDLRFKVRVQLTTNLPTTKLMASQLLASVSGQTKNPAVADLLTKRMIQNMDMPDSDSLLKDLDTVQMLQGQNSQLQQQLQDMQNKLNMMQNNQYSSELATKQRLAEQEMKMQMKQNVMDHQQQLEEASEGEAQQIDF